jgi:hypothetical protein
VAARKTATTAAIENLKRKQQRRHEAWHFSGDLPTDFGEFSGYQSQTLGRRETYIISIIYNIR